MIPAKQMPWDWFTKVAAPRGRPRNYEVKVNGHVFLQAKAGGPVSLLQSIVHQLPAAARVQVRRL